MTTAALCFYYGDHAICFERVARQGVAQRVQIQVHPDCRVVAKAPASCSDSEVVAAVRKRAAWVVQQLASFREQQQHLQPRRYVSGEGHWYLGKQYLLKVLVVPGAAQQVKLLRGKLEVSVQAAEPERIRRVLEGWYRERARELFQRRLQALLPQTLWVTKAPAIRILAMKTQWGSCSPAGRLTLNPNLAKAPRECIDYVILHELCHLAEHNHSERFYRLMSQVIPQWQPIKARLDAMAHGYLNS